MNEPQAGSRSRPDIGTIVAVVFVVAIAGLLWRETAGLIYPSDVFPKLVLASIGILGVLIILDETLRRRANGTGPAKLQRSQIAWVATVLAATGVYVAAVGIIGFYASTWLFLAAMFMIPRFAGDRHSAKRMALDLGLRALVATGVTATIYGCFHFMLHVPTPRGLLF